jgi:predicted outer membrane repeat protein
MTRHPPRAARWSDRCARRLLRIALLPLLLAGCSGGEEPATTPPPDRAIRVPIEAPTIQAAIDLAGAGDTVLVAPGVYVGEGDRDIDLRGKSITIASEQGPAATIIDCGAPPGEPGAGFLLMRNEERVVLDGFTIRGGRSSMGAAVYCDGASPTVRRCVLVGNQATDSGGAVRCKNASPVFEDCTMVQNGSPAGGVAYLIARSSPRFVRCILAFSSQGAAVMVRDTGSQPTFSCCDLYANPGGDWTDEIASQENEAGNLSADPRFCSAVEGDYRLRAISPCAPANTSCGEGIGALGVGCE